MTHPANVKVPNWAVVPIITAILALGGMWYKVEVLQAQKEDRSSHEADVRRILDLLCVGKEQLRQCQ